MKPTAPLPRCREIQPPDWPFYAERAITTCALLGLAALLMVIGAIVAAVLSWNTARAEGIAQGVAAGTELTRTEVRAACGCWFNDSRCDRPDAIIACQQLDWMKE